MSKAAKATELNFEDALEKLEAIVETLEGGEIPLEQLLARYEEGTRLVKFCQDRLSAAEIRIQQLDPKPTLVADGPAATPSGAAEAAPVD